MKTETFIDTTMCPKTTASRLRTACATSLLPLLLLLALPAVVQAQFNYTTNNGAITITEYTGLSMDAVTIPPSINGLPVTSIGDSAFRNCWSLPGATIGINVTSIGDSAFADCWSLASVTIGPHVTSIGDSAFGNCWSLTRVTIPSSVTSIGAWAFYYCTSLTHVSVPGSVTSIGNGAFQACPSLTAISVDASDPVYSSVDGVLFDRSQTTLIFCPQGKAEAYTIPNSVTSIGTNAFYGCGSVNSVTIPNSVTNLDNGALRNCTSLTAVYFRANAPSLGLDVFYGDNNATVYYLPGTTGWGPTFGSRPTALWLLPYPLILDGGSSFGVQTNGFGFIISWATNLSVVVEACTDLANPTWSPTSTNALSDGSCYFSDPQWGNYPGRFYRIRWP